jgi:hypothetical protein
MLTPPYVFTDFKLMADPKSGFQGQTFKINEIRFSGQRALMQALREEMEHDNLRPQAEKAVLNLSALTINPDDFVIKSFYLTSRTTGLSVGHFWNPTTEAVETTLIHDVSRIPNQAFLNRPNASVAPEDKRLLQECDQERMELTIRLAVSMLRAFADSKVEAALHMAQELWPNHHSEVVEAKSKSGFVIMVGSMDIIAQHDRLERDLISEFGPDCELFYGEETYRNFVEFPMSDEMKASTSGTRLAASIERETAERTPYVEPEDRPQEPQEPLWPFKTAYSDENNPPLQPSADLSLNSGMFLSTGLEATIDHQITSLPEPLQSYVLDQILANSKGSWVFYGEDGEMEAAVSQPIYPHTQVIDRLTNTGSYVKSPILSFINMGQPNKTLVETLRNLSASFRNSRLVPVFARAATHMRKQT